MKWIFALGLPLLLTAATAMGQHQKTYTLIAKKSGRVNEKTVTALPAPLKGMAALYSAMGGTNCMDQQCELTTALGLGDQGSDAQKDLIRKYFPGDKAAALVLGQDCYQPPSSSSSFSNFVYLSFTVNGNQVRVNYELDVLSHGSVKKISGPDTYEWKEKGYRNTRRVLYAWTAKS